MLHLDIHGREGAGVGARGIVRYKYGKFLYCNRVQLEESLRRAPGGDQCRIGVLVEASPQGLTNRCGDRVFMTLTSQHAFGESAEAQSARQGTV